MCTSSPAASSWARARPTRCAARAFRTCASSCRARSTGRFRSTTRPRSTARTCASAPAHPMLERLQRPIAGLGHRVINGVWRVGSVARFFALVLVSSATSFQRFRLVMREVYFSGVLSLVIIVVSGLFVGMVLGLQGFETLQKYG